MMSIVFKVSGGSGFGASVRRFSALTRQKLTRVARNETREIFQLVYRDTPPRNRPQGEIAVKRDLLRVFAPIDSRFFDFVSRKTREQRRVRLTLHSKDGTPYLIDWQYAGLTLEDMARFHRAKRTFTARPVTTASTRMVVPRSQFERYLLIVQARVGLAKAGWLSTIKSLGLQAEGYVTRHGTGHGRVIDRLDDQRRPAFFAVNNVEYAAPAVVENAIRSRRGHLESEIERLLTENARVTRLE